MVIDSLSRIEEESNLYSTTSSIEFGLKKLSSNGKNTIIQEKKSMYKRRKKLYGTLGLEYRDIFSA